MAVQAADTHGLGTSLRGAGVRDGWLRATGAVLALIAVGEGLFYLSLSDTAFEQASARRHGLLRQMLSDAAMVVAVLLVPRDQFIVSVRGETPHATCGVEP